MAGNNAFQLGQKGRPLNLSSAMFEEEADHLVVVVVGGQHQRGHVGREVASFGSFLDHILNRQCDHCNTIILNKLF